VRDRITDERRSWEHQPLEEVGARLDRAAAELPPPPEWLVVRALARARAEQARPAALPGHPFRLWRYPALAGALAVMAAAALLSLPVGDRPGIRSGARRAAPGLARPPERQQEAPWVAVFTGEAGTANRLAARLAEEGIRFRVAPVAPTPMAGPAAPVPLASRAGEGASRALDAGPPATVRVLVPPGELDRVKTVLPEAETKPK
jgi:hypothetical protein